MGLKARHYREELYRLRAHPSHSSYSNSDFVDERDSFVTVYLSLIPFVMGEYMAELSVVFLPSGLIFPMGFLLFWAFYYTYYKPGFLEDKLTSPVRWDFAAIPALILGVAIWFVKATLVELTDFFLMRWFVVRKKKVSYERTSYQKTHRAFTPKSVPLPADILIALKVLGLGDCRDWATIHHRYRELAKKFHPDLNKEITSVGRRFMAVDVAYRKLISVRAKYFHGKG